MWWPSPEALKDLKVNDFEKGFELEAPSNSECAEWLNFWSQSEEHQEFFNGQFVQMLTDYLATLNGENQDQPDQ
jgi:hypothetical protein